MKYRIFKIGDDVTRNINGDVVSVKPYYGIARVRFFGLMREYVRISFLQRSYWRTLDQIAIEFVSSPREATHLEREEAQELFDAIMYNPNRFIIV